MQKEKNRVLTAARDKLKSKPVATLVPRWLIVAAAVLVLVIVLVIVGLLLVRTSD